MLKKLPVFLLCLFWMSVACCELSFPKLTGRVVDQADMLSTESESRLRNLLAGHEQKNTNQLVVVTLNDLQGHDIESFGYQLGRYWEIGQKGKDNGVLLIVAKKERKIRIEVGYGLEGQLTDAVSSNIIYTIIQPEFKRGNFEAGIESGAASIVEALGGRYQITESPQGEDKRKNFWLLIFIFIIFWPMLEMMMPARFRNRAGNFGGGYGGGYGGGSGGGFGGGFSGGGGGFGGGGASGGW